MKIFGIVAIGSLVVLLLSLAALPVWALQDRDNPVQKGGIAQDSAGTPDTVEGLGRLLFFDPRLSGDALTSCSSCHMPDQTWTDGLALSRGYTSTLYFRNTPTLLNASRMPFLDWDGRFAQGDMTSLIRDHLVEAHFMNIDGRLAIERLRQIPEYEAGFQQVFDREISFGPILTALSAFVATLNSTGHPYQRYLEGETGALSAEAKAGLKLFQGKGSCAQCHAGSLLSDGGFHALGVPENADIFQDPIRHITFRRFFRGFGVTRYATMREDPGLFALTLDDADRGKFRTPSLLEAAGTAPYMHNGVFNTLDEVVRFYNQGGGESVNKDAGLVPLGLSDAEVASLVTFLASLGTEQAPFAIPEPPSYQPRTLGDN